MRIISTSLTLSAAVFFVFLSFNSSPSSKIQHIDIQEFNANPPLGRTGAPVIGAGGPNEPTCAGCHIGGGTLSAIGVVDFEFNAGGIDTQYTPGVTYPMQISVASGDKNGFQLTILDANLQKAGDFINGTNTSTGLFSQKEYVRHSASVGLTTFDFQWTAPSTNIGDVRAFYAFNKSNNSDTEFGDAIYIGDAAILSKTPVSIDGYKENPNQIQVFWDAAAKQIHLDYSLLENSLIQVNVQSLTGQLIQTTTLGDQAEGQYHQVLATDNFIPGVYIVAVFVNNRVYNYKMLLN